MDKFKIVFNIITDIWKIISRYKNKDVSQDKECKEILDELQAVCDKYTTRVGEVEGVLTRQVAGLFLEYLCSKEERKNNE